MNLFRQIQEKIREHLGKNIICGNLRIEIFEIFEILDYGATCSKDWWMKEPEGDSVDGNLYQEGGPGYQQMKDGSRIMPACRLCVSEHEGWPIMVGKE